MRSRSASVSLGRPRAAALPALLGIVTLLFAQLAPLLHFALVRHAVCAEHGELIHVDGVARFAYARAPSEVGRVLRAAPAPSAEHEHEATLAVASAQVAGFVARAPAAIAPPASLEIVSPSVVTLPRASFALYRLAPKTSPPALVG